jgi:hypothetical protein
MKEYIEREGLLEKLAERDLVLCVTEWDIKNAPAADVVERKRGEWVQIGYDDLMDRITCSCCKEYFSIIDNCTEEFNFCPNCGADMREVDHDNN